MIKTPGNLQDLRQRISGMGKAEAVGECGVGPGGVVRVESVPDLLGRIIPAVKRAGERSAGNRHAPFDVAGAGNGTSRSYRASPRPYHGSSKGLGADEEPPSSAASGGPEVSDDVAF